MTPKILTVLKQSYKLENPSMINKERNIYSKYCFEIVTDAKDEFLNRLSVKLDKPNASAKS